MWLNLPCCNFQTVPYITIRRKALKSLIIAEANSENHVTIEKACCELRSKKDRRLAVSISKLSISVEYEDNPGGV